MNSSTSNKHEQQAIKLLQVHTGRISLTSLRVNAALAAAVAMQQHV